MNRTSTTHTRLFTSFIALGVLATLASSGCSTQKPAEEWTPRPCSIPLAEREVLMDGLVVHVIAAAKFEVDIEDKPDPDGTFSGTCTVTAVGGNALIVSPTQLLMTDHQVFFNEDQIHVNGQENHYRQVKRVEGPMEGCGWSLIELETPLPMERHLPLDFKAEPKIGDTVFIASYWPSDFQGAGVRCVEEAVALIPRRPILIEGRVAPFPPEAEHAKNADLIREFLLLDTQCPAGTSGSPVIWRREDGSYAVVGVLAGGWSTPRSHWLTGEPTDEIIGRGQIVRQPKEYEPVETGSPQE